MNAKATYYLQFAIVLILSIVANCRYASIAAIDRGRLIQSVSANRLGGFDRETTAYDFAGYGFVDRLTYQYRGNQVTSITDEAPDVNYLNAFHFSDGDDVGDEYLYDANGNTITDLNRGIWDIHYDVNNRPRSIRFASGAVTRYIYSADSVKLRTEHIIPTVPPVVTMDDGVDTQSVDASATSYVITSTDYCGRFIYEDGVLDRINLDNGYLSYRDASGNRLTTPQYHFFLRDHLGNNRMDICAGDASFARVNHYYPFGLPMYIPGSLSRDTQRWKFGNKEFDRTSGLDLYDFEARAYDPATIRFYRPDDLAHKYHQVSSYVYCLNNPLINIDRDGKKVYLYATKLPGAEYIPKATHTFITIEDSNVLKGYFAYGAYKDGFGAAFGLGGNLQQNQYYSDKLKILNQDKDNLKAKILVSPPNGMTQNEFENKVVEVVKSFGNNPKIKYVLYPYTPVQGNCNSSTATILINSGLSTKDINNLAKQIPGWAWGFSSQPKPWTAKEQEQAVKNQQMVEERENLTR